MEACLFMWFNRVQEAALGPCTHHKDHIFRDAFRSNWKLVEIGVRLCYHKLRAAKDIEISLPNGKV